MYNFWYDIKVILRLICCNIHTHTHTHNIHNSNMKQLKNQLGVFFINMSLIIILNNLNLMGGKKSIIYQELGLLSSNLRLQSFVFLSH